MSFSDWLNQKAAAQPTVLGSEIRSQVQHDLMQKQAEAQMKAMIEEEIDKITEYAATNNPPQGVSGTLFGGHSLASLLQAVPVALRAQVHREMEYRYGIGGRANVGMQAQKAQRVYTYKEKMEMRMGWQPNEHKPFAFVEYRMVQDTAFMWILTDDAKSVVLEDDAALFPSDTLITKVRLLGGTNG